MVDQPEYGTNHPYYIDIISFRPSVKHVKTEEIKVFYLQEGLSSAAIAERLGVSKTFVISALHKLKIRKGFDSRPANASENYRTQPPPYGYELKNNRMQLSKTEQKICKLVVHLTRSGLKATQVAAELSRKGLRTRKGQTNWTHKTIRLIYDRWKDKL